MKITKQIKINKIISGGQTGVDRASLDTALELGVKHGGFCPKGRRSEDGIIPLKYNMTELEVDSYYVRTLKNIHTPCSIILLFNICSRIDTKSMIISHSLWTSFLKQVYIH